MYYVYVYELPFEWHLQTRVHMCVSSNMNSNFCVHIQWQFLMSLLAHFLLHSAVFQSKWWDVYIRWFYVITLTSIGQIGFLSATLSINMYVQVHLDTRNKHTYLYICYCNDREQLNMWPKALSWSLTSPIQDAEH